MDARTILEYLITGERASSGDKARRRGVDNLLRRLRSHFLMVVTKGGKCFPIFDVGIHRNADHTCSGYVVGGATHRIHLDEIDWVATQRAWDIALSPPPFPQARFVGLLPRNWERAFGYRGAARWLAVWWTPAGDEALFDDGQGQATAQWVVYLDLVENRIATPLEHLFINEPRGRHVLGSSDEEATHCLLLDLEQRAVYVAPITDALNFLESQYPASQQIPQEHIHIDMDDLLEAIRSMARRVPDVTPRDLCRVCRGVGWVLAEDGGYDECAICRGQGWLSRPEG